MVLFGIRRLRRFSTHQGFSVQNFYNFAENFIGHCMILEEAFTADQYRRPLFSEHFLQ